MCADTFTNMNEFFFIYTQYLQAIVKIATCIMLVPFQSQLFKHTKY